MFSKKSSKSTVAASVVSLVLCFAMLLGVTFAWFTATSSKAVASIKSGSVAVDFVDADGASLLGDTLAFVDANGQKLPDVLWEPGCIYGIEPVFVKNTGKLAINYKIDVIGIDGQAKLLEVIDWKVNGEDITSFEGTLAPGETATALNLVGAMDKNAGNQYQNLTADGIAIAVYATQANAEAEYAEVAAVVQKMDTMPTVEVEGADVTLSTAYTFKNASSEDVENSPYKGYNADYVVSFNMDLAPGDVILAGQYDNWSPDWEAFKNPEAIAAGAENRLLEGYNGAHITYEECCELVKEFNCGAYSAVEGLEMTVELRLYETVNNVETGEYFVVGAYTYKFGAELCEVEPIVDLPTVSVDGADVVLDTGYTFTPENASNAEVSIYKDYNADFVVSFNKALPAGAVILAGQYDAVGADWVAQKNPALAANQEVRLVKDCYDQTLTFVDVCNYVREFNCGAKGNGVPAGTVMTVELRLYETVNGVENGQYIVAEKCTYTFPADLCNVEAITAPTVDVEGADVKLDKAYAFSAPATVSPAYADYNADYVVSFSKAVAADKVVLAGQYDDYGPQWVAFNNPALAAGEGLRLVKTYYPDANMTYADVCDYVNQFNCGVKGNGVAAGTVMTVELRLYETVNGVENGNYIVAESVSYTF